MLYVSCLNLSAVVSAFISVATVLFLSGWVLKALGPAPFPSVSAFRFLPSILTLLLVETIISRNLLGNNHYRRLIFVAGVIALSISCMWSFESCLYVAASVGLYGGYIFLQKILVKNPNLRNSVV